jgi:hypothetical protein
VSKVAEGEDHSKNVIVFGVPEEQEQEEKVENEVKLLLRRLQEKPNKYYSILLHNQL